jgi:hypothetical protein
MPVVPAPDLTRLRAWLCEEGYPEHGRGVILGYADRLGTLEGLEEMGYLDPGDRAKVDELLEAAWPPVPPTSHAWDEAPWKEPHEQPRWTIAADPLPPDPGAGVGPAGDTSIDRVDAIPEGVPDVEVLRRANGTVFLPGRSTADYAAPGFGRIVR